MKKFLTCVAVVGLFGLLGIYQPASAQTGPVSMPVGAGPAGPQPYGAEMIPPPNVKVFINPPQAPPGGGLVVDDPLDPDNRRHHPHATTCEQVPSTVKKKTVFYGSLAVDFCLPEGSCHHDGACQDGGCNSGHCTCGCPRVRRYLMKRVVTEECPSTTCVPRCQAPAACCPGSGCPVSCCPAVPAQSVIHEAPLQHASPAQTIPVPPGVAVPVGRNW